jgi:plasmid maintenance system antidote protein VapI
MTTRLAQLLEKEDGPDWHVAARCGIHPAVFSRYKTGEREIPQKHAVRLADHFGVTVDEIRRRGRRRR